VKIILADWKCQGNTSVPPLSESTSVSRWTPKGDPEGKDAVVIVSAEEWRKQADEEQRLADFLLDSPLRDSGLVLERDGSLVRPVWKQCLMVLWHPPVPYLYRV